VLNGVNAMREIRAWESSYYTTTATAAAAKTTTSKRTAILGMSGHSLPIDIEAAKHAGMNAFLLKPLHPDTLVELIAVLVNDSTNGSTTTSYHQSLQSTMQSSGSNSSTSLSPRKFRATTTITLDSSTRGLLSKEHFGICGGISIHYSIIANNCDAVTTNSPTDNTNSSATAAASAATAADECALLKKQVALLQQGRKTVSHIRPRHNTLM
jgi:CheY-like chemotaxis protein